MKICEAIANSMNGKEIDTEKKLKANTIYQYKQKGVSGCIFRKNCASVPEERSAIPLQTEQSSAG